MAVFKNAESNIIALLLTLSEDKDFLRLISIDTADALSKEPTKSFYDLLNDRISMKPKTVSPTVEKGTFLNCWIKSANKAGVNNIYQYDTIIVIDIMSHLDLWQLDDNLVRVYRLGDIIDDGMIRAKINSLAGEAILESPTFIPYSENFQGFRLVYKYTGSRK